MAARKLGLPDWARRLHLPFVLRPVQPPALPELPAKDWRSCGFTKEPSTPETKSEWLFLSLLSQEDRDSHWSQHLQARVLTERGSLSKMIYTLTYYKNGGHGLSLCIVKGHNVGLCVTAYNPLEGFERVPPPYDQMAAKIMFIRHDEMTLLKRCPQTRYYSDLIRQTTGIKLPGLHE